MFNVKEAAVAKVTKIQEKQGAKGSSYDVWLDGKKFWAGGKAKGMVEQVTTGDEVEYDSEQGKFGPVLLSIRKKGVVQVQSEEVTYGPVTQRSPWDDIKYRFVMSQLHEARTTGKLTRDKAVQLVKESYEDALAIIEGRTTGDTGRAEEAVKQIAASKGVGGKALMGYIQWRFPGGSANWDELMEEWQRVASGELEVRTDASGSVRLAEVVKA